MNEERRSMGILAAAVMWCIIVAVLALCYKFVIAPFFVERVERDTSSESQYADAVTLALDSFSGYCVLRSPALQNQLKAQHIRLRLEDDGADYSARMQALRDGKTQMAVFTIDSFLAAGAKLGEFPASIVLMIDETQGADAIVAYKDAVAGLQDLDSPDARFVLTPNSPSEFLARVVLAHFSLPRLPESWAVEEDGAKAVYKQFRSANRAEKRAYVLWEPYVTAALAEPGAQLLMSSANLKGYIVDVLVAERAFLRDRPEAVRAVVEAYLRALYSYQAREGGMVDLVVEDAKGTGETLTREQADKMVSGIHWKNTVENYAHFGLATTEERGDLSHIEDMIANIAGVLLQTNAIEKDPVGERANTLFYDRILRDLRAAGFHPARKLNLIEGVPGPSAPSEEVEKAKELPALNETQWKALTPVGELRIEAISFARGTARLNIESVRKLESLAKRLQSLPEYYVRVVGHARAEGDRDANLLLARERAEAAMKALLDGGVQANRLWAESEEPREQDGEAQSVSFVVGHPPY